MKTPSIVFALFVGLSLPAVAEAATIRVPADAATIQQAIDGAAAGDTVLVSPGTYVENITFRGKAITVASEQGPGVTIIDGNRAGSVVTFASGENRNAVLEGFTVRNGANNFSGGGVLIQNSAPSIIGNWIVGNGACSGAGIYSYFSSPLIKGNTISRNYVYACSGASGLGVYIGGDSAAELIENVITENSGVANGGGVTLFAAGRAVLRSNVISRNITSGFSPCTSGGGIWMVNYSQATIVNNLVVGNAAGCGGGFYWGGSSGVTTFVNNTFADNDGAEGSAIAVSGVDARHVIYNNVIVGKGGQTAFYCGNSSSTPSPVLNTSDVFSSEGPRVRRDVPGSDRSARKHLGGSAVCAQRVRRRARRLPSADGLSRDRRGRQCGATDSGSGSRRQPEDRRRQPGRRRPRRHRRVRIRPISLPLPTRVPIKR